MTVFQGIENPTYNSQGTSESQTIAEKKNRSDDSLF